MDSTNYHLFLDDCLNDNDAELPLLDNSIFNDLNEQQFEIDHFVNAVPSNESDTTVSEFISISQNCSFDSISEESSNGSNSNSSSSQFIDQYNSSASSSTSEVYSPIQITPPETPPSCESASQNCQFNNVNSNNRATKGRSRKSKSESQDCNKKKKLLPLAPKTDQPVTLIQLNSNVLDQQKLIQLAQQRRPINQVTANNLLNNNNLLNYNLNNVSANESQQQQPMRYASSSIDEKLSKEELSKIKEKARRQRNRQSAMLSRQKKVDYVKGIEKRLEELTDENQNLKKENHTLKDLVNKLTFENGHLKTLQTSMQNLTNNYLKYPSSLDASANSSNFLFSPTSDANKAKKTISLLAVIFLIGLNMNLYNDNFKTYDSTKKLPSGKALESNAFKGRVLLWADNLETMNSSMNATTMNCNHQNLISQNETLILESKLRNWAIHQTNKQQFYSTNNKNFNFASNNKLDDAPNERTKLPWYLGFRNWNQVEEKKEQRKLTQIEHEQLDYEQIINSVKPKKDTYYFLSLNPADHLILPLNFYSNSSKSGLLRPRFSLLIPTFNSQFYANFTNSRNATKEFKNSNFLQLIEIDFEVLNMKPIQILKSRLHLNTNTRFTNRPVVRSPNVYGKVVVPVNSTTFVSARPSSKPTLLLRNQTNVQSQQKFNKTIGSNGT